MSATATTPGGPLAFLRGWWRADRTGLLRTVGLAVALVSFLWLWPSLIEVGGARPVLRNLALHAYVLTWMMAVSVTVRSIGSREVLVAFLAGCFLVPSIVFLAGWPALSTLGPDSQVLAVYWAPVLEEVAMLVGVALIAWRLARRAARIGRSPGVVDLMVVGFAVGAGYAVHEDALFGRVLASWPGETLGEAFAGHYGWLFPTFVDSITVGGTTFGFYTYHAGHGAFLGLLVGVAVVARHRSPWTRWLVPVGLVYAIVEHGLGNHMLDTGPTPWRYLFLDGHVVALAVIVGLVAAIGAEQFRRRRTPVPLPPVRLAEVRRLPRPGDRPLVLLTRALAIARYHRTRNAALTGAWRLPDRSPHDQQGLLLWRALAERDQARGDELATEPSAGGR